MEFPGVSAEYNVAIFCGASDLILADHKCSTSEEKRCRNSSHLLDSEDPGISCFRHESKLPGQVGVNVERCVGYLRQQVAVG